jgi:enoyl-CoA hydratase
VAGADISEFTALDAQGGSMLAQKGGERVFNRIENCPKPVVAAVNGFALGGGCELAMSCHFRMAAENAKFGQPEVNLGLIPGYGGTQRLTQLVGKGKAMELMMTADMIGAEEARALGLVNHVFPGAELLAETRKILLKILTKAPVAISMIIACVNEAAKSDPKGFKQEIDRFGQCFGTADMKEGATAFLEKRKAVFTGQ